ncbi:MAG: HEAT repeat domain-containing protein [Bacteroidales bacterium]|nr:HEAT repeat domain-containing protein [Bacteroidales bacterium]MDD4670032.1 HEAT repeat domain-containing protein [Bacteroidales bacterium]
MKKNHTLNNIITLICAILIAGNLFAATKVNIVKCNPKAETSFAIFVDNDTYQACKSEINAYRDVLQQEGLGTYILSADWATPEDVKSQIINLSHKKPTLEGMVFIGDIPVVRVRQGQHMTTAFKMNENTFPMEESSVTSDRFYDDLHLKFEFICKDSLNNRHFYYNLTEDGAQKLAPNFYSARMLVPVDFPGDKYEVLKQYLTKVVAAHKENNPLDHFIFFAGHGYNSDCLTVWRQQPIIFREYFPLAFDKASGNKFYNFRQEDYMKYTLFTEIQRPETDVFMFSEHGAPDTQYINGEAPASGTDENIVSLKRSLRTYYKRLKGEKAAKFVKEASEYYHLDSSMFSPEAIAKERYADSLARADVNIVLKDIEKLKTGARVTIFNACYNGSFHQHGYVAGYHIFNAGRNVVAQGNTVNVLQDKWADRLIGYLDLGIRIGFWQKEVCYLEAHLIGDPTFRFTPDEVASDTAPSAAELSLALANESYIADNTMKDSGIGSREYWKKMLSEKRSIYRATAIRQLSKLEAITSSELAEIYNSDPSWIVRLQTLMAIAPFADDNAISVIVRGINDPYEMIRRQACHISGDMGAKEFIAPLIGIEQHSHEVVRTQYAANSALGVYNPADLPSDYAASPAVERNSKRVAAQVKAIMDKNSDPEDRETAIRYLRNNPLHWQIDNLLKIVADPSEKEADRILMAEALGWFHYSVERGKIVSTLNNCLDTQQLSPRLKREMVKAVKRCQPVK